MTLGYMRFLSYSSYSSGTQSGADPAVWADTPYS
jgi:hypothetical protein